MQRTQLEQDHQRLIKSEKDLRKQMGKQRMNQLKSANEEEDKHIKKLEKLLKINKTKGAKKVPKMFHDGLDYALEMCLPENIQKMYAAAKEAADADGESDDGWQQDLAIATGATVESDTKSKTKAKAKSEAEKAKVAQKISKRAEKLREIEKKYFDDSDLDSDLSDVDSELGDRGGDDDESMADGSDDEAPEEVATKTSSSAKRKMEKDRKRAPVPTYDDDEDDLSEESDSEEDEEGADEESDGDVMADLDALEQGDDDDSEDDDHSEGDDDDVDNHAAASDDQLDDDDFSMGGSDDEEAPAAEKPDIWEDIYGRKRDKAGNVIAETSAPQKYVPPHLRARMAAEQSDAAELARGMDADPVRREKLMRLKKVLKGYLNRLSEANMHKITTDIDNLYMQNSRHDMNETLMALLSDALISPVLSKERMVLEHALLLAALHANIGSEVGAHVLQTLINRFDEHFKRGIEIAPVEDKTLDNIILILCHMYTFRVSAALNIHMNQFELIVICGSIADVQMQSGLRDSGTFVGIDQREIGGMHFVGIKIGRIRIAQRRPGQTEGPHP